MAASSIADCNACRPGLGSAGTIDPLSPACSPCADGTFSAGRVPGGNNCTPCPQAPGYTGRMVSRAVSAGTVQAATGQHC